MAGYTQAEIDNWGTYNDPLIQANLGLPAGPSGPLGPDLSSITFEEGTPTGLSPQVNDVSTRSIFDNANLLNAGATTLFSGLASLFSGWSSSKIYGLYEQQEKQYIENAQEQARRLQIKGDFALANLRSKHAIAQGSNELSVAGAGAGAISGSFLDKLMANKKYDTRDELAQGYETLWAVKNAERDGFLKAYNTAGLAYSKAIQQRNSAISGLFTGLAKGVGSILADMRQEDATQSTIYANQMNQSLERWQNDTYYSNKNTGQKEFKVVQPAVQSQTSAGIIDLGGIGSGLSFNLQEDPTLIQEAILKETSGYSVLNVLH